MIYVSVYIYLLHLCVYVCIYTQIMSICHFNYKFKHGEHAVLEEEKKSVVTSLLVSSGFCYNFSSVVFFITFASSFPSSFALPSEILFPWKYSFFWDAVVFEPVFHILSLYSYCVFHTSLRSVDWNGWYWQRAVTLAQRMHCGIKSFGSAWHLAEPNSSSHLALSLLLNLSCSCDNCGLLKVGLPWFEMPLM